MISSASLEPAPDPGWLPPRASSAAEGVDTVFAMVFWISAFFFCVVVGLTITFVVKYRARKWTGPLPSPTHDNRLELAWSVIPTALLLLIFAVATVAWLELTEPPPAADTVEIQVTARKWSWWFDHAGGKGSANLHVLVGQPVTLVMTSPDVIHSLYIPAFRLKQDIVPGRYAKMWFKATRPGTYPILCAEYCGTNHSKMGSQIVVHPDAASYQEWLSSKIDESMPLADLGARVYAERGCVACHTTDGTVKQAPSFRGLWGRQEVLQDGTAALVDENYIRESIVTPRAKLVVGFGPIMPPMPLEEREFQGIIEYIKTLRQ